MKRFLLASALAISLPMTAALPTTAAATHYNTVVTEDSRVEFHYRQMGVSMDGEFGRLQGEVNFDTDAPETGRAAFQVDLTSVDTGTDDGNVEVVGEEWFDADSHPKATFVSDSITAKGDGQYEVSGTLGIKGREQPVTIPAKFTESGDTGVFEGRFTLKRGDFAIGEGAWSTFDIVANEVDVDVRIAVKAD